VLKDRKVKGPIVTRRAATHCEIISLTECNIGTNQKLPFGVNTAVVLKV
jgi:hypothetical protein